MIRKVIKIDKEKCVGCGLCANACQQSAIKIIDRKAVLVREDYCDGLGNCLPVCPTSAIVFEEREVGEFAGDPTKVHKAPDIPTSPCTSAKSLMTKKVDTTKEDSISSQLQNWPVQIKLVSPNAPYYENANLLISADCCAYAYANFHNEFMRNKVTIIGCPKLDDVDYANKLTDIIKNNNIKSVTIAKMEVPCCNGLLMAVKTAIKNSEKVIPWQIVTVSTDGRILEN